MIDSSESFRNEIISKLFYSIPQDQIRNILSAIDSVLPNYEISHRTMALISTDGIPQVVKFYLGSKMIQNLSPKTIYIYKLRLIDFFTMIQKPFQDINAIDIRTYLGFFKTVRDASDSYIDTIRRELNSFFIWCVNNNYILHNPCGNVEHVKYQQKERLGLSAYDLEVLRWCCISLREKAMVDFFFSTGVRLSELHDANRSDINWKERSLIVKHGKGNKRRTVFFNAESELSLRKYFESRTDDDDAIFVTIRKPYRRLCLKAIEDVITKISNRAGFHVYPHMLRHTFATSGLRSGMPLDILQVLMGHTKPETTMIYAKRNIEDLRREHERVYV